MGMFDKDKEIGRQLTAVFAAKEEFVLYDIHVLEEKVNTTLGDADKTVLTVSSLDDTDTRFEVSTLGSAIANKAREAEPSDFPAVVCWMEVDSNFGNQATVLQFIRSL